MSASIERRIARLEALRPAKPTAHIIWGSPEDNADRAAAERRANESGQPFVVIETGVPRARVTNENPGG